MKNITFPALLVFFVVFHRLRKRGEKLLHSKYTVILVIVLTVIDCSLVIAELILDLYSVKSESVVFYKCLWLAI